MDGMSWRLWSMGVLCSVLCGVAGSAPAQREAAADAGEPWPVRWEVGERFALEWVLDSAEETARTEDGEAHTTRSMKSVALLRGVVEPGADGGVVLRLECERLRLSVESPYGEMVYDTEAAGESEVLDMGFQPMASGLMGREFVITLDSEGRLVALTGNEDIDRPLSPAEKAAAVLGSDTVLVPSLFPMFAIGERIESAADGAQCWSVPALFAQSVGLELDVCVAHTAKADTTTLDITNSGVLRHAGSPGFPAELREGSQLGAGALEGQVQVDPEGRLLTSEIERRVAFGIDVAELVGEEGAMVWRRYVWTSGLKREE